MRHFFNFTHRFGGAPTLHVFYHIVSDAHAPHIAAQYPVRSVQQFRNDLDWLLRHFMPVTLDELSDRRPRTQPGFHLSFDDGLRQCYDEVRPILLEKGIPATFFIDPHFLDNRALMPRHTASLITAQQPQLRQHVQALSDRLQLEALAQQHGVDISGFLRNYSPYMTLQQVQSLAAMGFTIGAQCCDYPMQVSQPEQLDPMLNSLAEVSRITGTPVPPLAYSFAESSMFDSFWGQLPASTQVFGCAGLKKGIMPNHYQRLSLEKNTRSAAATVLRAYLGYWIGGR